MGALSNHYREEFCKDGGKAGVIAESLQGCGAAAEEVTEGTPLGTPHQWAGLVRRMGRRKVVSAVVTSLILFLFTNTASTCLASTVTARSLPHHVRQAASSLLEVFQVYPPVLTVTPDGTLEITDGSSNATVAIIDAHRPTCQKVLAVHTFAYSYGLPFVGNYTPPACSFNRVTWNLTVTSAGRQFDRLGIVYLGDIEVFRTSTAEPTANGIEWTYLKVSDASRRHYVVIKRVKADAPMASAGHDDFPAPLQARPEDHFRPRKSHHRRIHSLLQRHARGCLLQRRRHHRSRGLDSANLGASISTERSKRLHGTFRRRVERFDAATECEEGRVLGCGNGAVRGRGMRERHNLQSSQRDADCHDQFWWSNVLQSDVNTFPQYGLLYGYSPFREVQLYIDNMLAGVAWPFPIIFTGGIVPGLWRPIVGIDAFDLKEDEIDITPWLPLLCDGGGHNFTIRISGLVNSGNGSATLSETTDSYWLVTGKVFIWLDEANHTTTGSGPFVATDAPSFEISSSIGKGVNGTNETLYYQVKAQRSLSIESTVNLSSGTKSASWRQNLLYSNVGNFTDGGNVEVNTQQTTGSDMSSSGYAKHFSYPLYVYSAFATGGDNISYIANLDRGKDVQTIGRPVFPTGLESFSAVEDVHSQLADFQGTSLSTTQTGEATFLENTTTLASFSFGTTEQDIVFSGLSIDGEYNGRTFPAVSESRELFERHVAATNGSVTQDEESLVEQEVEHIHGRPRSGNGFAINNVPGRGAKWHGFGRRQRL